MHLTLPELVIADKVIQGRPKWQERDSQRLELTAALSVNSIVIEGLEIRAKAFSTRPERGVCFNLQYFPGHSACTQLCRVEWNPLRPHTNSLNGPDNLAGLFIEGSHIHEFADNWIGSEGVMRIKNLPMAKPINPNPGDFGQLLDFLTTSLKIANMHVIEQPSWRVGDLFGG